MITHLPPVGVFFFLLTHAWIHAIRFNKSKAHKVTLSLKSKTGIEVFNTPEILYFLQNVHVWKEKNNNIFSILSAQISTKQTDTL